VAGGLATLGVVLGAVYMLTMYKHVIFGPVTKDENRTLTDLTPREIATVVPLVVLIFWIGLYPKPFLARIEPTVKHLLVLLEDKGATHRMSDRDRLLLHQLAPPARPDPELAAAGRPR
jgi:NADH-quinone oxidoreductase subunit M